MGRGWLIGEVYVGIIPFKVHVASNIRSVPLALS